MPDYRLRIGMKFRQQGRIYSIEQGLPEEHLSVKDILSGESFTRARDDLLAALFEGKLELLGDAGEGERLMAHLEVARIADLAQLVEDDPLRMEALRRLRYVERVAGGCFSQMEQRRIGSGHPRPQ
jgi:hypothetical protein